MSNSVLHEEKIEDLSPAQRAVYEIRRLRRQVEELENSLHEPVAVVGMGLRFPGQADSPASFWKILARGVDTISEIPGSRWPVNEFYDPDPDAAGKMYTRHGGFLEDASLFDAGFFGITPREAINLDPQHRLALEIAWEALENAGRSPASLTGTASGVFLALSNSDYGRAVFRNVCDIDAYSSTGNIFSVAAGRISFVLGFQGPAIVVDTACSGSLVTVHLACQSLRARECSLALAGGVNMILSPEININFSRSRMMAADGRCKTFDAKADGFVRGEGCGMVVLKRVSDAIADGDNILAVIRGSAVNQDGRSGGLTVPNGMAQEALIRQALTNARVQPEEIGYVEAHGTGTSLGDPIEAHALAKVLGPGRTNDNTLIVGSVKTNLGHLEAAAGVAGLIKVVLSLQNEHIPRHLHFEEMNPHIDWQGMPFDIPVSGRSWPRGEKRRLAGVSSFGFSGTNAHVIVEEAPAKQIRSRKCERPLHILALSACTQTALNELRERYVLELPKNQVETGDLCFTANAGRAHFEYRLAVTGCSREQLLTRLEEALPGRRATDREGIRAAFLFPGQGAQYAGMGKELYETQPVFRRTVDDCAALLKERREEPLQEVLWGNATQLLDQTAYAQPALFAVEYALAQLWKSWGIEPAVVLGHSVGEYVAACVAGVYSLEDGLKLISARSDLMRRVSGQGAMASVMAPEQRVREALAGLEEWVSIAALNAAGSVVISGYRREVSEVEERLRGAGIRVQRLAVSHAFHSSQMSEMEEEFEQVAAGLTCQTPKIELISSVTGRSVGRGDLSDPGYWRRQVREPVRFGEAMERLNEQGCRVFVEAGPGTTLAGLGRQTIPGEEALWAISLKQGRGEWAQMLESLGKLYVRGAQIDWAGFDEPYRRQRVPLPTYPFQRQRYWLGSNGVPVASQIDREREWESIRESASRQAQQSCLNLHLEDYPNRWAVMDRHTSAWIVATFRHLGLFRNPDEWHSSSSILKTCGILETYEKLIHRWLRKLATEGVLKQDGRMFAAFDDLPAVDVHGLPSEAVAAFRGDRAFPDYMSHCGHRLEKILTGKESALETLFPGGSFTRAEDLYERAPLSVYFSSIARAALDALLRQRRNGVLNVLEIGAGTGATTASLLPVFLPESTIYHFTDVSSVFLNYAEHKFSAFPFVRYGLLDIEAGTAGGAYTEHSFDLIVATNVLHATRDINRTIARVRSLLAPGGFLILCEATDYLSWFDITTGLIEGWQLYEDGLREDHPLLAAGTWQLLLERGGFESVMTFPDKDSPARILGQSIFVARTPSVGSPSGLRNKVPDATRSRLEEPIRGMLNIATLLESSPAQQHEQLVALVCEQLSVVLRYGSAESIPRNQRLMDVGMDSLMAIELRNRLAGALDLPQPLSATLVFDYPTVDAIADYLAHDVLQLRPEPAPVPIDTLAVRAAELDGMDDEEVAELLSRKLQTL